MPPILRRLGTRPRQRLFRARVAEAWRFPIVGFGRTPGFSPDLNLVTFVYKAPPADTRSIAVVGTFGTLYEPFRSSRSCSKVRTPAIARFPWPCRRLKSTPTNIKLAIRMFLTRSILNESKLDNGRVWSRFFTEGYLQPLILEAWEVRLLYRLIEQILPFRGKEAENFLKRYYFGLNREQRKSDMAKAFRLDDSVGEVNAIDKLLAREEAHRAHRLPALPAADRPCAAEAKSISRSLRHAGRGVCPALRGHGEEPAGRQFDPGLGLRRVR